jgi:hypothetical protein
MMLWLGVEVEVDLEAESEEEPSELRRQEVHQERVHILEVVDVVEPPL